MLTASLLQVMTTFMPPPPASTFLAFHPQDNNIIAIGMEDSTIHIYNVRVDEVLKCLKLSQIISKLLIKSLLCSNIELYLFRSKLDSKDIKSG